MHQGKWPRYSGLSLEGKTIGVLGLCAIGKQLCPPQLAKDGKFDEITKRAAEFVQVVKAARVQN